MSNGLDVLIERGFIEQLTHEEELHTLFSEEQVTFYVGFDPTADSLTVGHFVPVMAMAHLQRAGHRPMALVGGGTVKVGDPSGKSDMRKMLEDDQIEKNLNKFKQQLSRFIDFSDNKALMVNNGDWLLGLNYVDFIRDIGVHFSVNRMLTAESYKTRMEKGLTFLEFNYMLMQSYDFYHLYNKYNCKVQVGGNDQWSNIIGGVELVRRKQQGDSYGVTLKLLTTSEGKKMGKTEKGAVWLDPEKTSPYEFFQYWRNIEDVKVEECLGLLTFLPMDRVRELGAYQDAKINEAKEVLAFEITKIVHGEEEATKALEASKALFAGGKKTGSIPTTKMAEDVFVEGINLMTLLCDLKLTPSRSEARRLVQQGGVKINDEKVTDIQYMITMKDFIAGEMMIQKGKKVFHQVEV